MCNQWIPVNERLPKMEAISSSEFVLAAIRKPYDQLEVALRFYDYHRAAWVDDDGNAEWYPVTHWQPLPAPPTGA